MITWMEGELLLGVVLLILNSNQKPNLTNSQHHKVQQKDHFVTQGVYNNSLTI